MYEIVVGLEVHIQAKTKSKMFCGCNANYFGDEPNSHVCPVCLGLPGALPVPNIVAVEKCIKLALALGCKIENNSKFDRKNYFYPDLAKGYQISQFDLPFGVDGFVEIDIEGDSRRIRLTRIHMEEDTGKSIHDANKTLLDYNKSGMPLIELVSEPDFVDVKEVTMFAKRLRQIVRYLDISNANMERGQMRFEVNMSLRESGSKTLPDYKVEIKNIGSISVLEKVIRTEFGRQSSILDNGDIPVQETRGLINIDGETASQRVKESSNDYRYFPEPDIPPVLYTENKIDKIGKTIVELPQDKKLRYIDEYKLEPDTAEAIISVVFRYKYFEEALKYIDGESTITKEVAKWLIGDFTALQKSGHNASNVMPLDFVKLLRLLKSGKITGKVAKQVLLEMFDSGDIAENIIKKNGLESISDTDEIEGIVDHIIELNQKVVNDIDKNPNAIGFLVGQVMKETKGKASPAIVNKLLKEKLL